jgi:stearoyl-CoA desaturase (delta-9 desaturase)
MWRTKKIYSDILYKRMPVDPKFTKNVPQWRWFDLWASTTFSRLLWIGIYVWIYVAYAPSAWWYILLPFHFAMGPLHGVIINWFAHKYGHVNFETDNTSKNLFKVDWLMMGEGYHNNHHVHPSKSNFAAKKGEFDFCYPVIKGLAKLGVIRMQS